MRRFAFLSIFFLACSVKYYEPDQLLIKRQNYWGAIIKTNGFYYGKNSNDIFIFYNNGVVRDGWKITQQVNLNEFYIDSVFNSHYSMNNPEKWGSYEVTDSLTISINRWVEIGSWFGTYPHMIIKGRIINDTMFVLEERVFNIKPETKKQTTDTFYFQLMKIKPDSTNKYFEKWFK